jgi:hypothetical protein
MEPPDKPPDPGRSFLGRINMRLLILALVIVAAILAYAIAIIHFFLSQGGD